MDELRSLKVLVVDDDADSAELLSIALGRAGASVEVCHTGADALEIARRGELGAVLFDVGLPDMDGIELFGRLRGTQHNARAIGFAVAGRGRHERAELSDGSLGCAQKPIDSSELIRRLASRLAQRRVSESGG